MQSLYDTMLGLGEQLYIATKALLIQKGVKQNSDVFRSIEVQVKPDFISLLSAEYLEYISTGRRVGAKKIPLKYILEYIKANSIKGRTSTQQSTAFAIARSIAKRRGGTPPPTGDLLQWMDKNNIQAKPMTDNQLAFAIQTAIYKHGIKGKNFMDILFKTYEDMGSNKISTDVEKKINTVLDNIKLN